MFTRRNRCRPTRRCAIPRSKTAAGCCPICASAGRITRLSPDPEKGMAGRTVQALINVLEAKGGIAELPWVVNREAFREGEGR